MEKKNRRERQREGRGRLRSLKRRKKKKTMKKEGEEEEGVDHVEVATRSPQAPVKGPTAIRIRGALSDRETVLQCE